MKRTIATIFHIAVLLTASPLLAVNIEMVTVGNPGNARDTRYDNIQAGAVNYVYQIGKYEITAGQYTEFLNAVAREEPAGSILYDIFQDPLGSHIQQSGSSPNLTYSVGPDWADRPVNRVSFWDAVRFCNWLHNGQPVGPLGPETTEDGAYHDLESPQFGRSPNAKFFLPTLDEWYKAAYHDKSSGLAGTYFEFPTGSDLVPRRDITEATYPGNNANYSEVFSDHRYTIGRPYFRTPVGEFELSASPYGTFDQAGNVWEWTESPDITGLYKIIAGGSWFSGFEWLQASFNSHVEDFNLLTPNQNGMDIGFRIAAVAPVPEPSCLALFAFAAVMMGGSRIRVRQR